MFGALDEAALHTVSRTLSAWDHRGVTLSARRRIVIRDEEALAELADSEPND